MKTTLQLLLLASMALFMLGCVSSMASPTKDNSDFEKIGDASYYGPGFHGKTTASGEIFNQNAMTAAHKSLPFGTKLKVTNRETGQSVVVKINDRFPGTKSRIIDLSQGAFSKISPLARGVLPVELEIVN